MKNISLFIKIILIFIICITLMNMQNFVYAASVSEITDAKSAYNFFDKKEISGDNFVNEWGGTSKDLTRIIGYLENEENVKRIIKYVKLHSSEYHNDPDRDTVISAAERHLTTAFKDADADKVKKAYDTYYELYKDLKGIQNRVKELEKINEGNKDKTKEDIQKEIDAVNTPTKADELFAKYGGFDAFINLLEEKGFTSDEINNIVDRLDTVYASGDTRSDYGNRLAEYRKNREGSRI